jgi:hypothetical protein
MKRIQTHIQVLDYSGKQALGASLLSFQFYTTGAKYWAKSRIWTSKIPEHAFMTITLLFSISVFSMHNSRRTFIKHMLLMLDYWLYKLKTLTWKTMTSTELVFSAMQFYYALAFNCFILYAGFRFFISFLCSLSWNGENGLLL